MNNNLSRREVLSRLQSYYQLRKTTRSLGITDQTVPRQYPPIRHNESWKRISPDRLSNCTSEEAGLVRTYGLIDRAAIESLASSLYIIRSIMEGRENVHSSRSSRAYAKMPMQRIFTELKDVTDSLRIAAHEILHDGESSRREAEDLQRIIEQKRHDEE